MNDMTGRIVLDSSTAIPPSTKFWENADRNSLISAILMLEEKNKNLQAENAELRKQYITRFERIKNAANADEMAQMLDKVYMTGMVDAVMTSCPRTWDGIADISQWLQEIGTI